MNQDSGLEELQTSKPRDDEISLMEVASALLRNWRVIGALPLLLALVVGISTLLQDRTYTVSSSFVPQGADSRRGGASALAQQFGFNLTGDQSGQSPQFYVDLLRSHAVLRRAVETEYAIPDGEGGVRRETLIQTLGSDSNSGQTPGWLRAVDRLRKDISTSYNWDTGVVRFEVTTTQPALAEQIAARLLDLVQDFNTETRQQRALEEGRFIAERLSEAQLELLAAEGTLQEFLRNNRDFRNSPELLFEHDRLQRQVAMRQEVYTSLLRSAEQVRIDGVRDTPLLTVIDHPTGSATAQGRGTVLRATLAFVLGLMIAVFVAFGREYTRRSRETDDPHYREFEGLARQTWDDLRRPARWVGRKKNSVAAGDH